MSALMVWRIAPEGLWTRGAGGDDADQNEGSSLSGSLGCKSAGGEALFLLQQILDAADLDGSTGRILAGR